MSPPDIFAKIEKTLSDRRAGTGFPLAMFVTAVNALSEILALRKQHAFEVRFFRHGKKHVSRSESSEYRLTRTSW